MACYGGHGQPVKYRDPSHGFLVGIFIFMGMGLGWQNPTGLYPLLSLLVGAPAIELATSQPATTTNGDGVLDLPSSSR